MAEHRFSPLSGALDRSRLGTVRAEDARATYAHPGPELARLAAESTPRRHSRTTLAWTPTG